jgi:3-hydroxyanthranilate 3,4-dioxygenase
VQALKAFNLAKWIDAHRDDLKPPVCNRQIFEDDDFIVMVVGGPNERDDYHVDEGPELFYQCEGEMLLRTMQGDARVDIPIGEGEMLLLPPRVPHSPRRFAGTVGLVVERKRLDHELDGFAWYCDNCNHRLYDEFVYIDDIVAQLPPIFERFYSNLANRRCERCGTVKPLPDSEAR